MTAKRFTIDNDIDFNNKVETYELNCIRDNENQTFYFIADSIGNIQLFVKRLNELHQENMRLKAQLLYDGDWVCNICKYQCLVKTEKYYVAKCEKEHAEASKVDLQYCEDFELVEDYE